MNATKNPEWIYVDPGEKLKKFGIVAIRVPVEKDKRRVVAVEWSNGGEEVEKLLIFDVEKQAFISNVNDDLRSLGEAIKKRCADGVAKIIAA